MHAPRKQLKMALEAHLLPVLFAAGFDGPRSFAGHSLTYDYRRLDGDTYRFLTVQFEKHGGPKFRLNFSAATPASIEQRFRTSVADDMLREPFGEMRGSLHPTRVPYFKLFTWFGGGSADHVAKRSANLYPEIERWWRERIVGAHLWIPERVFPNSRRPNKSQGRVKSADLKFGNDPK
jgi:hypothetical protein